MHLINKVIIYLIISSLSVTPALAKLLSSEPFTNEQVEASVAKLPKQGILSNSKELFFLKVDKGYANLFNDLSSSVSEAEKDCLHPPGHDPHISLFWQRELGPNHATFPVGQNYGFTIHGMEKNLTEKRTANGTYQKTMWYTLRVRPSLGLVYLFLRYNIFNISELFQLHISIGAMNYAENGVCIPREEWESSNNNEVSE